VTGNDVNDARLALQLKQSGVRIVAGATAASLILSSAGAFDTEAAPPGPRLIYWLAIAALSLGMLEGLHRLLMCYAPPGRQLVVRVLGWALLALPLNTVAVLACKTLFGGWPSLGGFLHLLPGMAAILAALQFMLASLEPAPAPLPAPAPVPHLPRSPLRAALPLILRDAPVLALEAQDHYVRVHTSAGEAMVRIRLRDAIADMDEEGLQPHRSWWIARSAVVALQAQDRRRVLLLSNGRAVPVSRAARAMLGPSFRRPEQR
jgi:hypothetical protein